MKKRVLAGCLLCALISVVVGPARGQTRAPAEIPAAYAIQEGFVDAHGVLIYYKTVGRGAPLVIVHGGPGASHDYFLPYLLPLARHNRLIFIDERGSGRSQKLENPTGYTVENMVEDVEAVRHALQLGKIALLGHSYGGVLAQAYAFKYQRNLTHLILCSTFHSTREMNQVLGRIKEKMAPELRERINRMEKEGLFSHGKDYEKKRYTADYMIAAWGEGYFPYLYQNRPDPNFDPLAQGVMAWDLYREMWGSHGEYVIDGNLAAVEYGDQLSAIRVPTLISVGDHDESDPSLSREMHEKIAGSQLVIFPRSGHMTFVDQPALFLDAVEKFLHPAKPQP
ncbi:MAG: proline iminopeptidase-family hydrolase [Acidobacteria bacterium]|nr:proline iminopeptidase-family hydrolase [Acidobacteriota bacterium]